jgi:hypothetical protein
VAEEADKPRDRAATAEARAAAARARAAVAAVARAAVVAAAAVVVAAGAGEDLMNKALSFALVVSVACSTTPAAAPENAQQRGFASPDEAANTLIDAVARWDVPELVAILGKDGENLVASNDTAGDRVRANAFVAKAREKHAVTRDANDGRAWLIVGNQDWPLPIPIVKSDDKWYFDAAAGHDEIVNRRIGENELDVITICSGYAEAQRAYAASTHDGATVHQYAQRLLSTPGKQDGLAWQNKDGSWGGPVAEVVAKAVEDGYLKRGEPFHGYYFKVLHGQGEAATLGKLDYVIEGAMVGGFALVAWPAEYGVTGVKTFIVSYDDVVYQKDLGPTTSTLAPMIDRYDPDASWKRTDDEW